MDPREPVHEAVLEQGGRGAQLGCSLVCHRFPILPPRPPRSTSDTDAGAARFARVGRAWPASSFRKRREDRARGRLSKSRGMRECVLRGRHGGGIIAARLATDKGVGVDPGRATGDPDGGGDRARQAASHQEAQGTPELRGLLLSPPDALRTRPRRALLHLPAEQRRRPGSPRQPALLLRQPPRKRRQTRPDGQSVQGYDPAAMADVAETLKRVPLFAGVKDRDWGARRGHVGAHVRRGRGDHHRGQVRDRLLRDRGRERDRQRQGRDPSHPGSRRPPRGDRADRRGPALGDGHRHHGPALPRNGRLGVPLLRPGAP